jgi:hypothetical protein
MDGPRRSHDGRDPGRLRDERAARRRGNAPAHDGGRKLRLQADTARLHSEHTVDGRLIVRYSPPVDHPWPLRVGATWDLNADWLDGARRPGQRIFLRCAATEEARLTVPAGTFDTLHVVCQTHEERQSYSLR